MGKPQKSRPFFFFREVFQRVISLLSAAGLTLALFLVLPLMQHLSKPPQSDLVVRAVDTAKLDSPPPPPKEKHQEEIEPEEIPPELQESVKPLDLSQLEMALNPGLSDSLLGGDFAVNLNTAVSSQTQDVEALFSIADLDQKPRIVYQPSPILTKEMRSKLPGTVYIIFVVDQQGKVQNPIVQKASDPVFEKSAINAIKQWKFEPGKRNGRPVRFRMRVPITFPKG